MSSYEISYYGAFQGRSAPIQMLLLDAGADYTVVDVVQGAADRVVCPNPGYPVFAPPVLKCGDFVLGQTTAILAYLGSKHGYAPTSPEGIATCNQLSLDAADVLVEAFKAKALEDKGAAFYAEGARLSQWLVHFDKAFAKGNGAYLMGADVSHADFNLFCVLDVLDFFFDDKWRAILPEKVSKFYTEFRTRSSVVAFAALGKPALPASMK